MNYTNEVFPVGHLSNLPCIFVVVFVFFYIPKMRDKENINRFEAEHGFAKSAGRKIVPNAVHPPKKKNVKFSH